MRHWNCPLANVEVVIAEWFDSLASNIGAEG